MEKKFTVLKAGLDSSGDCINLSGVKWDKAKLIPVVIGFNPAGPIGFVKGIEIVGDEMIANCELIKDVSGLYPAIGFKTKEREEKCRTENYFDEIELTVISVSSNPNSDDRIKPIK